MNYNQCMEYINNVTATEGMNFDLSSVRELLVRAGNPDRDMKIIHIAGTNAKGSLGTYLASVLDTAGIKTGRFFSPALFSYREVFCVYQNFETKIISKEQTAKYITFLADLINEMTKEGFGHPSAFEIETVMALMYMRDEKCEVAIIECGLGGRDDATNIIDHNFINVITPVGFDHMGILGDTIEEIAMAKCGIIHEGEIVVTGQTDEKVVDVIKKYCDSKNATLYICRDEDITIRKEDLHAVVYDDNLHNIKGIKLTMLGSFQAQNANIALRVLYCMKNRGFTISENDIKIGMSRAHFKGRFDKVNSFPAVYADGAHNPMAAKKLRQSIDRYFEGYRKIYVMGVFADKDYDSILDIMKDEDGILYTCSSLNKRSLKPDLLAGYAKPYFKEVNACPTVKDALGKACDRAKRKMENGIDINDKTVVICFGSLSIMKDVYSYFEKDETSSNNLTILSNVTNAILKNEMFKEKLAVINEFEKNRRFCGHNLNHLLDVARIAWILATEKKYCLDRDMVYGAALLHDIGRAVEYTDGTAHEIAGEAIACRILEECNAKKEMADSIIFAIRGHNNDDEPQDDCEEKVMLAKVIKEADNLSRNCFACGAKEECKWPQDMKNKGIII